MQKFIFHIACRGELKDGLSVYEPESVASKGFIHCAEAVQIPEVARRKFAGRRDVVLMKIDTSRVAADIQYENRSDGRELFPHIYGSLNMDAVVSVEPLQLSENPEITAIPLTIAQWEKVERLFATSSGVAGCWCMWPKRPPGTHKPDREANKAAMGEMLDAGQSPGLIALSGEQAVGWCAIGPRYTYPQYKQTTTQLVSWAIPCLYVDPTAHRRRVARVLIEAAVALASDNAAVVVEGPPPYWLPGDTAAIQEARDMFLENRFEQVGPGVRMPELRRVLQHTPPRL